MGGGPADAEPAACAGISIKGWLPEQNQLGAVVGPVVVEAKTFAETDLFTWNQFAPRIGVVFDLTGDGNTVLKGNYGLYWHNPGSASPSDANPNTGTKSATWSGTTSTANGAGSQARRRRADARRSRVGSGSIPTSRRRTPHEAAVWLERQLSDTIGVRAGFVYKTEDDLIDATSRPAASTSTRYGVPYTFTDIGVDGVRGTADDRALNYSASVGRSHAKFPTTQVVMNLPQYARYKTAEVSMSKRYGNRWSASIGGAYTWMTDFPNDYPAEPEPAGRRGSHGLGLQGQRILRRAVGHSLSPVLRHQSGVNYARGNTLTFPDGRHGIGRQQRCYMEPTDANREDNIWVFDVRAEKTVKLLRSAAHAVCSSICSTSRTATRLKRSAARLGLGVPEAVSVTPRFRPGSGSGSSSDRSDPWGL